MHQSIMAIHPMYADISMLGAMSKNSRIGEISHDGKIAVIKMHGPIFHHDDIYTSYFKIPTTEGLSKEISSLVDDSSVDAIILSIDSPGGGVSGLKEFADQINEQGKQKQIIAVGNTDVASAAFFIASAATKFFAMESSMVGSVGTVAVHFDMSKKLEKEGINVEMIHAGKYKVEGNSYEPLSKEAREHMQELVDTYNEQFISSVARYKGISQEKVLADFGQGRMYTAKKAMDAGMIDGIMNMKDVVFAFGKKAKTGKSKSYAMAMLKIKELA